MTLKKSEQTRRDQKQRNELAARKGAKYAVQCVIGGTVYPPGSFFATQEAAEAERDLVFGRTNAETDADIHRRPQDLTTLEVYIAELRDGECFKIDGTSLHGQYDFAARS